MTSIFMTPISLFFFINFFSPLKSLYLKGLNDPFKFLFTPAVFKPGSKCSLRFLFVSRFAAKYQSCQPWYPQKAILDFPVYARAILIEIT